MLAREDADTDDLLGDGSGARPGSCAFPRSQGCECWQARRLAGLPAGDLADLVQELTTQMHAAAADLQFELRLDCAMR